MTINIPLLFISSLCSGLFKCGWKCSVTHLKTLLCFSGSPSSDLPVNANSNSQIRCYSVPTTFPPIRPIIVVSPLEFDQSLAGHCAKRGVAHLHPAHTHTPCLSGCKEADMTWTSQVCNGTMLMIIMIRIIMNQDNYESPHMNDLKKLSSSLMYSPMLVSWLFWISQATAEGSACTLYLPVKQDKSGVCKCYRLKTKEWPGAEVTSIY